MPLERSEKGMEFSMNVVNFILNPKVLNIKTKERPGLVNPLEYYLNSL